MGQQGHIEEGRHTPGAGQRHEFAEARHQPRVVEGVGQKEQQHRVGHRVVEQQRDQRLESLPVRLEDPPPHRRRNELPQLAPLRPAGENTTPLRAAGRSQGWAGHLFVAADARWVLRDISLDGNTFKSSHHVDKRALVADVGYGLAVTWAEWKFAFARYHRSREFRGQQEVPVYGSFTISRRF